MATPPQRLWGIENLINTINAINAITRESIISFLFLFLSDIENRESSISLFSYPVSVCLFLFIGYRESSIENRFFTGLRS